MGESAGRVRPRVRTSLCSGGKTIPPSRPALQGARGLGRRSRMANGPRSGRAFSSNVARLGLSGQSNGPAARGLPPQHGQGAQELPFRMPVLRIHARSTPVARHRAVCVATHVLAGTFAMMALTSAPAARRPSSAETARCGQ